MTTRIFKQFAQGFGSETVQVTVTLGGNLIYSGTVATLDQPLPPMPSEGVIIDNVAWQWEESADFEGQKSLEIAVTSGTLLLADSFANNPKMVKTTPESEFLRHYTAIVDGVAYEDPLTEAKSNGIPLTGPYNPELSSQWWWKIPAGTTFTAVWHTQAVPALTPIATQVAVAAKTVASGAAIEPFAPVTASGGYDPLAWKVSPDLPQGLSIGPGGVISGTPVASSPTATYTVTVTDNSTSAQTGSQSFQLTIT
jgi:hypothetical protein